MITAAEVLVLVLSIWTTLGLDTLPGPGDMKANRLARNCMEHMEDGMVQSGPYIIYPFTEHPEEPVEVFCEQEEDGGGWTVIQNRYDGSVNFFRSWSEYAEGFGNHAKEHYLGNTIIAALTGQSANELMVHLEDWKNEHAYAHYQIFHIDARFDYQLQIALYNGTAGSSLNHLHVGHTFTTFDADNDDWDNNCADSKHGAWWYHHCSGSNLNGRYYPSADTNGAHDGMYWAFFRGNESLKASKMMIRPRSCDTV